MTKLCCLIMKEKHWLRLFRMTHSGSLNSSSIYLPVKQSHEESSRRTLFAATYPEIVDYCESFRAEDWPVCVYFNHDCSPATPSEKVETASSVWETTLELIGLPTDAVEQLIQGGKVKCKYKLLFKLSRPFEVASRGYCFIITSA